MKMKKRARIAAKDYLSLFYILSGEITDKEGIDPCELTLDEFQDYLEEKVRRNEMMILYESVPDDCREEKIT